MSQTQGGVLNLVLDALDKVGIEYVRVGSLASAYWGRPRTTQDADLVVALSLPQGEAPAGRLADGFDLPEFVIREALEQGDQFNAIHVDTGFKIDFWPLTESEYDHERFQRRRQATFFGRRAWVSTAEDTILAKLLWYRHSGGGTRRYQDAVEIYEIQRPHLDEGYLDLRADRLGLTALLQQVRRESIEPG